MIRQIEVDKKGQYLLANMEYDEKHSSKDLMKIVKQLEKQYKIVEEKDDYENEFVWDDVPGVTLNLGEVRRVRAQEIKYVRDMKLYEKVPIE